MGIASADVMVNMLVSSVVDRGFEIPVGSDKRLKLICVAFSAKHAVQMRNSKLARNQDNVSEWGDMSIRGLLRQ